MCIRDRHKDGSRRNVQTSGVPIIDGGGQWLGYRGLDRDVSEQHHLLEALRESEAFNQATLNSVGFELAVLAVSYTHLDVYKRQAQGR